MTNVAICYGTRYGTTAEIVQEMVKYAEEAGAQVEAVELKRKKLSSSLEDYDLIIIGSGIQATRWTSAPLKFIEKNIESLSNQKVALFVVCGDAGNPNLVEKAQADYLDVITEKYPTLSPVSTGLFAGMFDFKRYNFVTRALVKAIAKRRTPEGEEIPELQDFRDWDTIREWTTNVVQM
jgi:menaquinone-dependent protoporphyrinogen oxidase